MKPKKISLAYIAAFVECIEAVDMQKVYRLRQAIRAGKRLPPIDLRPPNKQGYLVIDDGNHRTLAHLLEGKKTIEANVFYSLSPVEPSWRWPRIAPVAHTLELFKSLLTGYGEATYS